MPIRQMTKQQILNAKQMLNNGSNKTCVAKTFSVTRVTLRKILKEYEEFGDAAIDKRSKPYPHRSGGGSEWMMDGKKIRSEFLHLASMWNEYLYR